MRQPTPHNIRFKTCPILIFALFSFIITKAPCSAEPKKNKQPTESSFSYLYYQVQSTTFPLALRKNAKSIDGARLPLPLDAPNKKNNSDYNNLIEAVTGSLSSLNRAEHYQAYSLIGFLHELSNRPDSALQAYEASLKLRSDNPLSLFRQAVIYLNKKNIAKCKTKIQELFWRSNKALEELYYILALCAKAEDNSEELLKYLSKAIEINSRFSLARIALLNYYTEVLKTSFDPKEKADIEQNLYKNLKTLYETDRDNRDIALIYAETEYKSSDLLLQSGRLEKSEKIARSLVESSNYKDEDAVALLARIKIKKRQLQKADDVIRAGLKYNPNSKVLQEMNAQLNIQRQVTSDKQASE